MFLRGYLIVRTAFSHTEFSDPFAQLHCERHGFTANTRFSFRCYLTRYPGWTVIVTLLSSTLVLSYVNRVVERPFVRLHVGWDRDPFINNVYLTVITMTTVGFGDYVPLTAVGKLVTILTALWGGFIITLLIVSVNGKCLLTSSRHILAEQTRESGVSETDQVEDSSGMHHCCNEVSGNEEQGKTRSVSEVVTIVFV